MRYCTLPLRYLLSLHSSEASFRTRGFTRCEPSRQHALEEIGRTVIAGYNAALTTDDLEDILRHISAIPQARRGFAVEGTAMGTAIADLISWRRPRLAGLVRTLERDFTYFVHAGVGMALARARWRRQQILAPLDPLYRWLAFDGLGFHDTYLYHRQVLDGWRRQQSSYAVRAYDQGVGRALWFVAGGSVANAISLISRFPRERQSDLWSGLGLAIAYAGPAHGDEIDSTLQATGSDRAHFAQGVAFACEASAMARHVPAHTELTAQAVWGIGAEALSGLVRDARERLSEAEGDPPRYELLRRSVAASFSSHHGTAMMMRR
jgi:hypothetical protein